MDIEVRWTTIDGEDDPAWGKTRVLYAYLAPSDREILYIGKADGTTVRGRWNRSAKEEFWTALERERGIKGHVVVVGEIYADEDVRLTRELLADIESLLIMREQPWGNVQSTQSRIGRPGMRVECSGDWPGRPIYMDRG